MKVLSSKITLIIALVISVFLFSCSEEDVQLTQEDIVKQKIEEYLTPKLNDPGSYEFVELEFIDSILYKQNIQQLRNWAERNYKQGIEWADESEKRAESALASARREHSLADHHNRTAKRHRDSAKEQLENAEKWNRVVTEIDSTKELLGESINDVAAYNYYFTFRANNAFGALTLHKYIVQLGQSPDFKIIHISDNHENKKSAPDTFPGFIEILEKNETVIPTWL